MSDNPFKSKKCKVCKKVTYYNPSAPYQTSEERDPKKCAFCGSEFK